MTESDRPDLGALLTQALGFYGQTLSPFALGVWWLSRIGKQSLTDSELRAAVEREGRD